MRCRTVLALVAALASPAHAGEVRRQPCPADAPAGVRLPDRPGCRERAAAPAKPSGLVDIGGGTSVRVGGRVRGEIEFRR